MTLNHLQWVRVVLLGFGLQKYLFRMPQRQNALSLSSSVENPQSMFQIIQLTQFK